MKLTLAPPDQKQLPAEVNERNDEHKEQQQPVLPSKSKFLERVTKKTEQGAEVSDMTNQEAKTLQDETIR